MRQLSSRVLLYHEGLEQRPVVGKHSWSGPTHPPLARVSAGCKNRKVSLFGVFGLFYLAFSDDKKSPISGQNG